MWGINAHTNIEKELNMFLFKSSGLQRFLLGLCLGVEDGL